jgi:hypothetical protein
MTIYDDSYLCCCCCFVDKFWSSRIDEPRVGSSETTVIVIYLELPPWSQRSVLTIDVATTTSLATVKKFVALLQSALDVTKVIDEQPVAENSG